MFVVVICSLIAIVLTIFETKKIMPKGMALGFAIITFLSCIHYDYGNDYMAYLGLYRQIENTPFVIDNLFNGHFHRDCGWVLLNYLFKPVGGFFSLVCVMSIAQNVIIYRFIRREVCEKWYPYAVFVYLVTTSFYLMSFSMLRQWLVMCLFLWCWSYIKNRQWIRALLIILLCTLIHDSAKVLVPFAFWGYLPVNKGKISAIMLLVLILVIYFSGEFVENILSIILDSGEFDIYLERYGENSYTSSYGIGFMIQMLPFLIAEFLLYKNKGTENQKRLVALAMLSYLVTPLENHLPMIGRIGFYFSIFNIAALPIIYSSIAHKYVRYPLMLLAIIITTYGYFNFFTSPVWIDKYSIFKTIFTVIS